MTIIRKLTLFIISGLAFTGCSDNNSVNPDQPIPDVYVNQQLNLTNIQYADLRRDGGYIYLPGGVKGIIVYRQTQGNYIAFERNCPYQPYDACATIAVDQSSLFMRDTCCNSQFDFSGNVIAGPSRWPVKRYTTSISGNLLFITN